MSEFREFVTIEGGRYAVRMADVASLFQAREGVVVLKTRCGDVVDVKGSLALITGGRRGPDDPLAYSYLSGRARSALERLGHGTATPAQVAALGKVAVASIRGVGRRTVKEVTDWLRDFGTEWS